MTPHTIPPDDDGLLAECMVDTFRSGGPGGQHANKVESAVRLTHEPTGIVVTSQETRSQHRNKQLALKDLRERLEELNRPRKKRIRTKPTKASKEKRLETKRQQSQKKAARQKPSIEE